MKFLLEFVSCCGNPTHDRVENLEKMEKLVISAEENRWLVPASAISAAPDRRSHRKKQPTGAGDWKPTLKPISENRVALHRASSRNATMSSAGKDSKKRSTGADSGDGKVRPNSYSDSYNGSTAMPTIIPAAFSPTPFMF